MTRPLPASHRRPSLRALPALVVACSAALSCSSGEPTAPAGQVEATDTYLLATVTVLDVGFACVPGNCDPEFYDCRTLAPVTAGTTYVMTADEGAAGYISDSNFTVSGTDLREKTGLALEVSLERDATGLTGAGTISLSTNGSFVELWLPCERINPRGQPESHFEVVQAESTVTLTTVPISTDRQSVLPAIPQGTRGLFSPAGIVEGTFSVVATTIQQTASGPVSPKIRADGCFRVNVPAPEQGVPVTPTPTAPAAGCP